MDYDQYLALEEQDAFEAQYADEMDMLNDMEGNICSNSLSKQKKGGGRRQLFENKDQPQCSSKRQYLSEEDFENDLLIDEDLCSMPPERKKARMESFDSKKPAMPTTLDDDRDALQAKKDARRDIHGSPAMIYKILSYRQSRYGDAANFFKHDKAAPASHALQLTKVLLHPPVHSDFISSTSTDGQRCYMRMHTEAKLFQSSSISALIKGAKSRKLLPQSVSEMRQAIYEMKEKAIMAESLRLTEEIRRQNIIDSNAPIVTNGDSAVIETLLGDTMNGDDNTKQPELEEDEGIYSEEESQTHGLWLDKFAPTQYTHLLSDESVNRSLLKWLKKWDYVVFGRELQPKKENISELDSKGKMKKPFFQAKHEFDDKLDEYNRPFWKVALLYGPPGLGKTTLAHIIAKHAGYHVVEMNASDDRSAETFKRKLEETTQMRSVLGQDQRPNCLIIDEIDGAPQAAINVLIASIMKTRKGEHKKNLRRKRTGSNDILLRPIICICNDLYVPSLRQLRQSSFILHFPPTQSARLASRLVQLCRIQKMQCDMTTLLKLCEKADNDIRSCINTLQFIKSSGTKLGISTVRSLDIGQKDQHKNIFKVWQDIFQLPKCKRKMEKDAETAQISAESSGQKMNNLSTRAYTIHHMVSANGDYEKTLQGVYEHFLKMKVKDHDMACVNKAQEWVQFYDSLLQMNRHLQEWSVMRYYPYLFVTFHMMFACISVPRIGFPTHDFENTKRSQKCEHLIESMFCDMIHTARCYVTQKTAILDVIPYILEIMTPTIRPVNTQLFSPAERKLVRDLVCTMLSYNLTYRQERNEDGQYAYVLEPDVTEICKFEGIQEGKKLPYSTKQMIAKEVEMERMRRNERMMEGSPTQQKMSSNKKPQKTMPGEKNKDIAVKQTKNHLQSLKNNILKAAIPKEKPVVNFFSRFKKIKKIRTGNENEKAEEPAIRDPGIGNSQTWYKFHEGFSNAVRQTVYVKDFL